jgi:signal transduction histidine kinase
MLPAGEPDELVVDSINQGQCASGVIALKVALGGTGPGRPGINRDGDETGLRALLTFFASGSARRRALLVATAAIALAAVSADIAAPLLLRSPSLRAILETCAVAAGLGAAKTEWSIFRHAGRRRDLLLCSGLVILTTVDLISYLIPTAWGLHSAAGIAAGAPIGTVLAAMLFLEAAGSGPTRTLGPRVTSSRAMVLGAFVAAGIAEALGLALREATIRGHGAAGPMSQPIVVVIAAAGVATFAVAAMRFLRSASAPGEAARIGDDRRSRVDPFTAAATIVLAFSSLDWLALDTGRPDIVSVSVILRVVALTLAFLSSRLQLGRERWLSEVAAVEGQRRQLARDLHDSLCQDLAFIAAHGEQFAGEDGGEHPMAIAARRALAYSRGALADLSAPGATSTQLALRHVADELAGRYGITVEVYAQEFPVDARDRDALVRIAREATVNAAKHGHATHVTVSLTAAREGLVLRVEDNGCGIKPAAERTEGFGMASMRERAREIGGRLEAHPAAGGGTRLEVSL